MNTSEAKHKAIIFLFFIAIFSSTFYLFFQPSPVAFTVVNNMDEIVVLLILLYAALFRFHHYKNTRIPLLLLGLFVVGFIGNLHMHTPMSTIFFGAFNIMKPILLFWALCQFDFEWDDLYFLFKLFEIFFPLIFISYVLDFLFPGFRALFGRQLLADRERGGFRALCGLFYRPTYASVWGIVYFVYYRFYAKSKPRKWKYVFALLMQISSLKVKDLLGLFSALAITFFKKISKSKVILLLAFVSILFSLYATFMPAHFNKYIGGATDDSNVARVALTYTSVQIASDAFPFGLGWGMYGSPLSQQTKSPVYRMYGIDNVFGLNFSRDGGAFMCDTFWPMLLGELGVLGTLLYCYILWLSFWPFIKKFRHNTANRQVLFPSFLFIILLIETIGKQTLVGPPHSLILWGTAGLFYSLQNKLYPYKEY